MCVTALVLVGCGCSSSPIATTEDRKPNAPFAASAQKAAQAAIGGDAYDLERDEQLGGHTLKKHVGRTDEELRERLRWEREISAASTWTDRTVAEQTIAAALKAEHTKVQRWIERGYPRPNLALRFDARQTIGRSLRRGESQVEPCTQAVIVLKPDGRENFHVLTAYPEARE